MDTQFRFVSKKEAHKLIDDAPGDEVMVMTYNNLFGISDHGRYVKKRKSKKMIDKSTTLVLTDNRPILTINLHQKLISDLSEYNRENIVKSIMLAKLE